MLRARTSESRVRAKARIRWRSNSAREPRTVSIRRPWALVVSAQGSPSDLKLAKYTAPSWIPSANMRREYPLLPSFIPGGAAENPMGVAAMTLSGGEYSIHGTNEPNSIGRLQALPAVFECSTTMSETFIGALASERRWSWSRFCVTSIW